MQAIPSQALSTPKKAPSKLVLGFLVAATTAIIGMAGVAGATPSQPVNGGYGGSGNTNINIGINGDNNNVVIIIINWMFNG